jgi:hypothetical protein
MYVLFTRRYDSKKKKKTFGRARYVSCDVRRRFAIPLLRTYLCGLARATCSVHAPTRPIVYVSYARGVISLPFLCKEKCRLHAVLAHDQTAKMSFLHGQMRCKATLNIYLVVRTGFSSVLWQSLFLFRQ